MGKGCCDLLWHHRAVTGTQGPPLGGGGGSTHEVSLAPMPFPGNSNGVSSLGGGRRAGGRPWTAHPTVGL